MSRIPLSVTIIALNEEGPIRAAIQSVRWADEVLVVDSGSQDRTIEVARELGAKVVSHPWPGYGQQKNFAQQQARHDWVLNIDADEQVPPELASEIQRILASSPSPSAHAGYRFPRKTFYLGKWIRHGGWYPNYLTRLAHRSQASWSEPEVHEELRVSGTTGTIDAPLHHFAFNSIHDQMVVNLRYSRLGAHELLKRGGRPSVLKLLLKPLGKFIETYILKGGWRDGWAGYIISVNAAHSIFLKYATLLEPKIRGSDQT